jgi:hypothetical protein
MTRRPPKVTVGRCMPRRTSFRHVLASGIATATMICAATGLAVLTYTEPVDPPERSQHLDLIERHGCWTDAQPADVEIPGHVIVTGPGGITRYAGPSMVHRALERVFDGKHPRLEVHAFCR